LLFCGDDPRYPAILSLIAALGVAGVAVIPLLTRVPAIGVRQLRLPTYAAAVGSFAAVCILYGSAFYLFVAHVMPVVSWGEAAGVFLVSWLAGFLAVFAPQGIGVFEAAAGFLLTGSLAAGVVAVLFGFRALSVLSDLGLWVVFRLWLWVSGTQARGSKTAGNTAPSS
jgi:hypothetical protein